MSEQDWNPSRTLENIKVGGQKMLATARARLVDVEEALDRGEFVRAKNRCAELYGKLTALAEAEQSLGVLAGTSIIRAEEVREGMYIGPFGKVVGVEMDRVECVGGDHMHILVTLEWEDGTKHQYDGNQEIVISSSE